METALFSNDYDHLAVVQYRTDHDSIVLSLSRDSLKQKPHIYAVEGSEQLAAFFPLKLVESTTESTIPTILSMLGVQDSTPLQLKGANIRLYIALGPTTISSAVTDHCPYLISVALTPGTKPNQTQAEAEADLHAWYEEEHINLLSQVPGWKACRRFALVDHTSLAKPETVTTESSNTNNTTILDTESIMHSPPKFLALHAWRDLEGFNTTQYQAATNTSWRTRVMDGIISRERNLLRLV